jgi:hypothetical protein
MHVTGLVHQSEGVLMSHLSHILRRMLSGHPRRTCVKMKLLPDQVSKSTLITLLLLAVFSLDC